MKNPKEREEQALRLIVKACDIVEGYMYGITSEKAFLEYPLLCDGVALRLENVGEYVKRLTDETKAKADAYEDRTGAEVKTDWRGLAGIRDMIAHKYDSIEFDIVYEAATKELPQLKETCEYLIEQLEKDKQQNHDDDD